MAMPRLKSATALGGVRAPKVGEGKGIPHMPSGAVARPRPPLSIERGQIMGLKRGGFIHPPAPRPMPTQRPQQQQQSQPVNPYAGIMGMNRGGLVGGGFMGGTPRPQPKVATRKATPAPKKSRAVGSKKASKKPVKASVKKGKK